MLENTQETSEVLEEVEEVIDSPIPSLEDMEEVALSAVGRMSLQDLIDDSVQALVEVYKARPHSYYYDANNYREENKNSPSPFLDVIQYLREVNPDTYDLDDNALDRDTTD